MQWCLMNLYSYKLAGGMLPGQECQDLAVIVDLMDRPLLLRMMGIFFSVFFNA